jgi:hypothetical protein
MQEQDGGLFFVPADRDNQDLIATLDILERPGDDYTSDVVDVCYLLLFVVFCYIKCIIIIEHLD